MERNNKLMFVLIFLGVVLVLVAACFAYAAWMRGVEAQDTAGGLLEDRANDPLYPENASTLHIGSIDLELPVIWEFSPQGLETSICRYRGPDPGGSGNLIITGHDYLNGAVFGQLDRVRTGDEIILYDQEGVRFAYSVYACVVIDPNDVQALDETKGNRELTLMTCSDNANKRLLVRCAPSQ